ncbi:hypothetical protein H310_01681 [Aphanomyces invadans]|uniref:Uncharacterized protein n=1 Tax=Aphanomyces invadans TaxID=157072 RepID=A0A024USF5_9STRA|nr:hypothetical protein H310_01681 [Aphanomyces invadans]ETW09289.1 hypothetical protein H310_01681 [Aphanomyces invadans]|eukprot:XP_008863094.1 hypothetical protein H310_01681 [Aphanomyces invadans]
MNILDLGFFAATQSLQHKTSARNVDEVVANVEAAFVDYPSERLDLAQLKQLATHVSHILEERCGYLQTRHHHHQNVYTAPQAHSQTYNMPTAQSTIHNTLLDLLKKTEATGKTLQQTQQSMLNAGRHAPS